MHSILLLCSVAIITQIQTQEKSSTSANIAQLIKTLTPRSNSAARPALEYRIREERAVIDRWEAVERIVNLGDAAGPAVPLLSRLVVDRFEPTRLKVRMAYALERIGPAAEAALPSLKQLLVTGDSDLKQAAEQAIFRIEEVPRFEQLLKTGDEEELARGLAVLVKYGDDALPLILKAYQKTDASDRLRRITFEAMKNIRFENTEKNKLTSESRNTNFSNPNDAILKQTFGREVDQVLLRDLQDGASEKAIEKIAAALSETVKLPRNTIDANRAQSLANAFLRQRRSISSCSNELFDVLVDCYLNSEAGSDLRETLLLCIQHYLDVRANSKELVLNLLANPSFRHFTLAQRLIRARSDRYTIVLVDLVNFPELLVEEKLLCEGTQVVISPDRAYVAILGTTVQVFEVENGTLIADCGMTGRTIKFSPDSKCLGLASDEGFSLFGIVEAKVLLKLPIGTMHYFRFHDGGRILETHQAIQGEDAFIPTGKLALWSTSNGEPILSKHLPQSGFQKIVFSDDGKKVAAWDTSKAELRIWDTKTGMELAALDLKQVAEESHDTPFNAWYDYQFAHDGNSLRIYEAKQKSSPVFSPVERTIEWELQANKISRIRHVDGGSDVVGWYFVAEDFFNGSEEKIMPIFSPIVAVREKVWDFWDWETETFHRRLDWSDSNSRLKDYLSHIGDEKVVVKFLTDSLLDFEALNGAFESAVLDIKKGDLVDAEMAENARLLWKKPQHVLNGKPSEQLMVSCKADSLAIRDLVSGEDIQRLKVDNLLAAQAYQSAHGDLVILFEEEQVRVWQLKTHKEWLESK